MMTTVDTVGLCSKFYGATYAHSWSLARTEVATVTGCFFSVQYSVVIFAIQIRGLQATP